MAVWDPSDGTFTSLVHAGGVYMFAIPREGGGTISVLVWHMAHLLALCMLEVVICLPYQERVVVPYQY
jgi:hypothetical protein